MVKPIVLPISYRSDPKGLKQAENDLKGFASGVGKAIGAATAAVVGIGVASVKAFADFDAAMNKSLAIMGDVSDTLRGDMSDAAREVAKTTTFSANEAAESYFFLASAGLDAEASIAALPAVAKFAQAGMFDMAQATDLLTDAQSALGMSSDDALENLENMVSLSDVLVKANTLANASVEQFSSALTNKAAASMRTLNIEMEAGVAVLAVFADQGLKGEQAGTAFNATLIGLTKTARTNASAYEALGVSVFDSSGELNSMADIVADLEKGLDGMSTQQADATLAGLGLTRQALDGTKALLGNSEALREYETELRNAGGTTDEVSEKQLQTFSAQLALLGSAVTDVGIRIGKELGPVMEGLVDDLGPVIDEIGDALVPAFTELVPIIQEVVSAIPGIVRALTPLLPVIVQVASTVFQLGIELLPVFLQLVELLMPALVSFTGFLSENSEAVARVAIAVGALVLGIKAYNTILGIAKLAVVAFGAAKGVATVAIKAFNMALRANPIGIVITLVAALIAGLVSFFTLTETGQKIWAAFTNFLLVSWNGFKDGFFSVLESVGAFFKSMINGYISMWEGFINFFIGGINLLIRGLNKLSVKLPATALTPAFNFGVNIPEIPRVQLPRLAEGGIVKAQPGGIFANIGEGRYDEAVIPLDGKNRMGSTYNITVNAGMGTDGARVGEEIVSAIRKFERVSGPVFARA
jgi:TP901 family phage tail tape measure protein